MTNDPAVTAAAEALAARTEGVLTSAFRGDMDPIAATAVAAARPVIEAEVRARIAAEIEANAAYLDAVTITHQTRTAATIAQIKREGVMAAARIAKGELE